MDDGQAKDVAFPLKGMNVATEYELQPDLTTPLGVNVRASDPASGRVRGAMRPGLTRYPDDKPGGLTSVYQHLEPIVDPTVAALGSSVPNEFGTDGGDPGDPGVPDPSTNNDFLSSGDPLDRRVPAGRRVPTRGGGHQPNKDIPAAEPTDEEGNVLYVQVLNAAAANGLLASEIAALVSDLTVTDWAVHEFEGNDPGNNLAAGLPCDASSFTDGPDRPSIDYTNGMDTTGSVNGDEVRRFTFDGTAHAAKRVRVAVGVITHSTGDISEFFPIFRVDLQWTDGDTDPITGGPFSMTPGAGTTLVTNELVTGPVHDLSGFGYATAQSGHLNTGYSQMASNTDAAYWLWVVWDQSGNFLSTYPDGVKPADLAAILFSGIEVQILTDADAASFKASAYTAIEAWLRSKM